MTRADLDAMETFADSQSAPNLIIALMECRFAAFLDFVAFDHRNAFGQSFGVFL